MLNLHPRLSKSAAALHPHLHRVPANTACTPVMAIAVIPFLIFRDRHGQENNIDRLCKRISQGLSGPVHVSVIPYAVAKKYIHDAADIGEAGLQMGASLMVTGSIRTRLNYCYLNIQLVTAGGAHLWACCFEQEKTGGRLPESGLCASILQALNPQLHIFGAALARH